MATINPYDQSAWSTYTPLTSQEILMPAMMMRERHDKLDEEYATINDELQKVAFIAEHENDPAIKQKYSNYINDLTASRDALMDKGLNSNSRRRMLDLRGRYQSEIQPINMGYQMKSQDINNYNQMIAKDPTYIGTNPSQRTVSDYINNGLQPFAQRGMSGAVLTKMASDYLTPFSQELTSTQLRDLLVTTVGEEQIPQYMDYIKKHGYKPGTEGHKALMKAVKEKVIGASGMSGWATPEQLQAANLHIDLASSSTIGKEQSQIINNSAYTVAAQKQAAKEAALAAEESRRSSITPIPIPGEIELNETDRNHLESFKKGLESNTNRYDKALSMATSYEDFKKLAKPQKGDANYVKNIAAWERSQGKPDSNNTTDFSKWDFNHHKAAFELKAKMDNMTESEKQDLIRQTLPGADESEVLKYATMGVAGYGLAAKLALTRGVPWATIAGVGKGALKLSLPLIVGDLFAQPSHPEPTNTATFLDVISRMDNKSYAQYNSIKKIKRPDGKDYTDDEIVGIMESDLTNRHAVTQEVFNYNDDAVNSYQLREAKNYITDLRNSGGVVTVVDKNNKKKMINASSINKELDEDVLKIITDPNSVDFKGQVSMSKKLNNKPSYQFTKTIGDKTYYIDVPARTLESDYATSRAIYSTIDRGISSPTTIQTNDGQLTITPQIQGNGIQYVVTMIDQNGQKVAYTPEAILARDRMNVGNRYFNKEATRKEIK